MKPTTADYQDLRQGLENEAAHWKDQHHKCCVSALAQGAPQAVVDEEHEKFREAVTLFHEAASRALTKWVLGQYREPAYMLAPGIDACFYESIHNLQNAT